MAKKKEGVRASQNKTKNEKISTLKPTKNRKASAMKRVLALYNFNKQRDEIIQIIQDEFGYTEKSAIRIITFANQEQRAKFHDYAKKCAKKNFNRLENIIETAYDKGDYKMVIECINIENKMAKLYNDTNINLQTEQPFIVQIGNDTLIKPKEIENKNPEENTIEVKYEEVYDDFDEIELDEIDD